MPRGQGRGRGRGRGTASTRQSTRQSKLDSTEVTPDSEDDITITEEAKKTRKKSTSIPWDSNKKWIAIAVQFLPQNPTFRLKLFSDSTADANAKKRKKVQASEGKTVLYGELAEAIFANPSASLGDVPQEHCDGFAAERSRYAKSLQQQFARYVRAV